MDTINGQAEQEKNYEESSSDEDFVCDLNEGGYFRLQFKCKRLFKCETYCLDDSSCSEGTNSTESNNELNDDSESLSSTSSCATIPNEQLISKNKSKQKRFYLM